jgi:hypothetical protein
LVTGFVQGINISGLYTVICYGNFHLNDLIQQLGRAGRDGKPSLVLLYYPASGVWHSQTLIMSDTDEPHLLEVAKVVSRWGCIRKQLASMFSSSQIEASEQVVYSLLEEPVQPPRAQVSSSSPSSIIAPPLSIPKFTAQPQAAAIFGFKLQSSISTSVPRLSPAMPSADSFAASVDSDASSISAVAAASAASEGMAIDELQSLPATDQQLSNLSKSAQPADSKRQVAQKFLASSNLAFNVNFMPMFLTPRRHHIFPFCPLAMWSRFNEVRSIESDGPALTFHVPADAAVAVSTTSSYFIVKCKVDQLHDEDYLRPSTTMIQVKADGSRQEVKTYPEPTLQGDASLQLHMQSLMEVFAQKIPFPALISSDATGSFLPVFPNLDPSQPDNVSVSTLPLLMLLPTCVPQSILWRQQRIQQISGNLAMHPEVNAPVEVKHSMRSFVIDTRLHGVDFKNLQNLQNNAAVSAADLDVAASTSSHQIRHCLQKIDVFRKITVTPKSAALPVHDVILKLKLALQAKEEAAKSKGQKSKNFKVKRKKPSKPKAPPTSSKIAITNVAVEVSQQISEFNSNGFQMLSVPPLFVILPRSSRPADSVNLHPQFSSAENPRRRCCLNCDADVNTLHGGFALPIMIAILLELEMSGHDGTLGFADLAKAVAAKLKCPSDPKKKGLPQFHTQFQLQEYLCQIGDLNGSRTPPKITATLIRSFVRVMHTSGMLVMAISHMAGANLKLPSTSKKPKATKAGSLSFKADSKTVSLPPGPKLRPLLELLLRDHVNHVLIRCPNYLLYVLCRVKSASALKARTSGLRAQSLDEKPEADDMNVADDSSVSSEQDRDDQPVDASEDEDADANDDAHVMEHNDELDAGASDDENEAGSDDEEEYDNVDEFQIDPEAENLIDIRVTGSDSRASTSNFTAAAAASSASDSAMQVSDSEEKYI